MKTSSFESISRLNALRKLLTRSTLSTQEELKFELEKLNFKTTQSTISRDLRKLGAIRAVDPQGRTVYRLPDDLLVPVKTRSLHELVTDIQTNQSLIVIHTLPGSASLIARHLDQIRPAGILGTIAGDDTVFVAPAHNKKIKSQIGSIVQAIIQAIKISSNVKT